MDYIELEGPNGQQDNMGGLTQRLFIAPLRDFLVLQQPSGSPTTPGDTVEITTAHTFKTGKCFIPLYCTMDKGKIDTEIQGERDGESFKQTGEFFIPGTDAELHGFASLSKTDRFIILTEMPDGKMIQLGTKTFPSRILGKFMTGTNSSGVRGYTFTIETMNNKNLVYSSTVSLTPAP